MTPKKNKLTAFLKFILENDTKCVIILLKDNYTINSKFRKDNEIMKTINAFESIAAASKSIKDIDINYNLYCSYLNAKEAENDYIDFNDVIWDNEVEHIVSDCRTYGIDYITISSTSSELIETLAKFEELGCKMIGLVKIKSRYTDFMTGEKRIVPAVKMKIN